MAGRALVPDEELVELSPATGGAGGCDAVPAPIPPDRPLMPPVDAPPGPCAEEDCPKLSLPALLLAFRVGGAMIACIDIDKRMSSPFFMTAWSKAIPTCDSFCSLLRACALVTCP